MSTDASLFHAAPKFPIGNVWMNKRLLDWLNNWVNEVFILSTITTLCESVNSICIMRYYNTKICDRWSKYILLKALTSHKIEFELKLWAVAWESMHCVWQKATSWNNEGWWGLMNQNVVCRKCMMGYDQ